MNDRAATGVVIDITQAPYNADPTGSADCRNALASAWGAASPGSVIYFPPGRYRFASGAIYTGYKDNITIRGAGSGLVTWAVETTQALMVWSSPGSLSHNPQSVTGTKTKGSSALTVENASGYTVGDLVAVVYENEVDPARIQAGAAPVWNSKGYPGMRQMTARVTNVSGSVVTIDPPLSGDATHLAVQILTYPWPLTGQNWMTTGVGIEGFSVEFSEAAHTSCAFAVTAAQYCWFYDLKFLNWSKNDSNGSCISLGESYRCEVRKCYFRAETVASSDGAIGLGLTSSIVVEDNIFKGGFGTYVYDNGNANNNVIAYNYAAPGLTSIFHNAHPSLNLIEGNDVDGHQSDGYHGSSSHNTLHRNRLRGGHGVILNRFKRKYLIRGNVLGINGVNSSGISWGNPNMGNGAADGFAGPTGLSNQVGQVDYSQPGFGPDEYVVQPGDVFAGDFWSDWEVTGMLTTRLSDTSAILTVSSGRWFTGASPTGASDLLISAYWAGKAAAVHTGSVSAVAGNQVTVWWPSGVLPAEGTELQLYFGPAGWQERDLDVQASSTIQHNYFSAAVGVGAVQNPVEGPLDDSLAHASKPAWFGTLEWPPFDPDDETTHTSVRIPAGWREINGNENYLPGGEPPETPSELSAEAVSASRINLTWTDRSHNEAGFKIEQWMGGEWTLRASVGAGVQSFSVMGLASGTLYTFRVRASNGGGDSGPSNEASATTLAGNAPQVGGTARTVVLAGRRR